MPCSAVRNRRVLLLLTVHLITASGRTIGALSRAASTHMMSTVTNTLPRRCVQRFKMMPLPEYVPDSDIDAVSEAEAVSAFANMQYVELNLPNEHATGPVNVSYLKTSVESSGARPPVLLIHGFDISSLEYRRLLPLLDAAGIEAYAPCVSGWGFTDTSNMRSVGTDGKRAQLLAFHKTVLGGRAAVWVGASLGASIALDCYMADPAAVAKIVTLDPGFFTEAPPAVPSFVGRLLLQNVLSAPAVRRSIAKQAYCEKDKQTDDAIRCGNLHLNRVLWEEDSLQWLLGGAYGGIDEEVPKLAKVPTLTLWGRQDEVIPPATAVPKLVDALPMAQFRWVETCGHTPHLEQPAFTADAIVAFINDMPVPGDADVSDVVQAAAGRAAARQAITDAAVTVADGATTFAKEALEKARAAVSSLGK